MMLAEWYIHGIRALVQSIYGFCGRVIVFGGAMTTCLFYYVKKKDELSE